MKKPCFILFLWLFSLLALPALASSADVGRITISDVAISEGDSFVFSGTSIAGDSHLRAALLIGTDASGNEQWRYEKQEQGYSTFLDPVFIPDGSCIALQSTFGNAIVSEKSQYDWDIVCTKGGKLVDSIGLEPGSTSFIPSLFGAQEGYFVFSGERDVADVGIEITTIPALELRDLQHNVKYTP